MVGYPRYYVYKCQHESDAVKYFRMDSETSGITVFQGGTEQKRSSVPSLNLCKEVYYSEIPGISTENGNYPKYFTFKRPERHTGSSLSYIRMDSLNDGFLFLKDGGKCRCSQTPDSITYKEVPSTDIIPFKSATMGYPKYYIVKDQTQFPNVWYIRMDSPTKGITFHQDKSEVFRNCGPLESIAIEVSVLEAMARKTKSCECTGSYVCPGCAKPDIKVEHSAPKTGKKRGITIRAAVKLLEQEGTMSRRMGFSSQSQAVKTIHGAYKKEVAGGRHTPIRIAFRWARSK